MESVNTLLTLAGGVLNMENQNIGSSSGTIGTSFQSGTLANVAEINGGA